MHNPKSSQNSRRLGAIIPPNLPQAGRTRIVVEDSGFVTGLVAASVVVWSVDTAHRGVFVSQLEVSGFGSTRRAVAQSGDPAAPSPFFE